MSLKCDPSHILTKTSPCYIKSKMLPKEAEMRSIFGTGIRIRYDRETASFNRKEAWGVVVDQLGAVAVPLGNGLVDLYPFKTVPLQKMGVANKLLRRLGFERVV